MKKGEFYKACFSGAYYIYKVNFIREDGMVNVTVVEDVNCQEDVGQSFDWHISVMSDDVKVEFKED